MTQTVGGSAGREVGSGSRPPGKQGKAEYEKPAGLQGRGRQRSDAPLRGSASPKGLPAEPPRSASLPALPEAGSGAGIDWRSPWTALLILRGFLAFTFVFAGLQKLTNPNFFKASSPGSIQSQLAASVRVSPLAEVARISLHAPVLVAVVIAWAEVSVGIGIALGFLTRAAAAGGLALSATFFFLVSFHTSPYYFGSDIVFVFAWTPFVLGGGGPWSLDGWITRHRQAAGLGAGGVAGGESGESTQESSRIARRLVLNRLGLAGLLAVVVGMAAGVASGLGRTFAKGGSSTTTAPGLAAPLGSNSSGPGASSSGSGAGNIGPAGSVPVGSAVSFTAPDGSGPAFVLQPQTGRFVAFSAVCTHAGCIVAYDKSNTEFKCPCHGSVFDAGTGAVVHGPASQPLASFTVTEHSDGALYAT